MKRVVVTGMGALTPLGNNVDDFWSNLISGVSGAGSITKFNTTGFKTKFGCEVKDFDPKVYLTHAEIKRSDLFSQYALYVASQAIQDSDLNLNTIDPFDIGVIWGTGQGGMETFEKEVQDFTRRGSDEDPSYKFNPFFIPKIIVNMAAGMISIKFGLRGINYSTVSACSTSNSAIMDAFNYIKMGKAKIFVTGGSEAPITEASIGGFTAMRAMSTNNDAPQQASRPFDTKRDGFVIGEGAGALILEEYEHAKARGARIYAEIVGAAMTADAYHMTSTHPEGIGAAKAMQLTLEEAKITSDQVDYINAHATSTPVGDLSEIHAINSVFQKSEKLSISATKSMTGHLLGAAGAIEAISCIQSINESIIPPTINIHELDPKIPDHIQIVKGQAEHKKVNFAMSNTFGFGGHNGIVLFKKI